MHRAKAVLTIAALTAMMLSLLLLAPRIAGQSTGAAAQAQFGAGSVKISGQILTTIPPSDLMFPAQAQRGGGAASSGRGGTNAAAAATLYLVQRDAAGAAMATQQMRGGAIPTGPFEIPNVRPGLYDLFVSLPDARGWGPSANPGQAVQPVGFGRASFEARNDVTGLQITVHQGVDLKGRVTVDGRQSGPGGLQILVEPDARAMAIQPYQFISRFQPSVGADGLFVFPALPEAQYQVRVGMTGSSNLTLVDILLDGKSVKSSGINIDAKPPGTIEIALKTGGPALTAIAPGAVARGGARSGAASQGNSQSQTAGFAFQAAQPGISSPPPATSISKGDGGPATAAVVERATGLAAD
ncbi:MAG TPA: hypothetical protein VFY29_12925, partial [Terriglobia bacterium]|nr:hypothetical protein [Terriglobia bacterium]